jgi:hypothetical protein
VVRLQLCNWDISSKSLGGRIHGCGRWWLIQAGWGVAPRVSSINLLTDTRGQIMVFYNRKNACLSMLPLVSLMESWGEEERIVSMTEWLQGGDWSGGVSINESFSTEELMTVLMTTWWIPVPCRVVVVVDRFFSLGMGLMIGLHGFRNRNGTDIYAKRKQNGKRKK